jgi:hypothetical protein
MKNSPKFSLAKVARIVGIGAYGDYRSERRETDQYCKYDSDAADFDLDFTHLLGSCKSIEEYVRIHYIKNGPIVAIELGGPARKLFGKMDRTLFSRTAGFTLLDKRSDFEKNADEEICHDVITADVFYKSLLPDHSWSSVEEWVKENGQPMVIIERMVQGIDLIRSVELFMMIVSRWYSLLAPGGVIFLELPRPFEGADFNICRETLYTATIFKDASYIFDTLKSPPVMRIVKNI